MPLIRIETRPKSTDDPVEKKPAAAKPERPSAAKSRAAKPSSSRSSLSPALIAGGLFGLMIIAGLSAFFIARSRGAATPPAASGAASQPGAPGGASAAAPGSAGAGAVAPAAASIWPGPINADYARDAQIAFVNNEPYAMAQLETAVRIARALGTLSGDKVPAYTDREILNFQVVLLKRQIDNILIRQAMQRDGLVPPTGPVDDVIKAFLDRVGASDAQLQTELAANGVTRADLQRWFEDSRTTGFYVQTKLMGGETDQSKRDAIVQAWLSAEWERLQAQNLLLINFYDPEQLKNAASQGTTPSAPGAATP